jgi:hypothetical protein
MTARTGLPGQYCQDRTARPGYQQITARIRQPGQERKERTARKGQPEKDNQNRTART